MCETQLTIAEISALTGHKMNWLMIEAMKCGIVVTINQPFDCVAFLIHLASKKD